LEGSRELEVLCSFHSMFETEATRSDAAQVRRPYVNL
jgi:hypothetical protein